MYNSTSYSLIRPVSVIDHMFFLFLYYCTLHLYNEQQVQILTIFKFNIHGSVHRSMTQEK
jgi:hypothetical protein